MNNKKLLFERMNLIGQMPINANEGAYVPRGDSMDRILKIFDQEGYFPIWNNGKISFVETEKYPQEYEKFRQDFTNGWNTVSLPF